MTKKIGNAKENFYTWSNLVKAHKDAVEEYDFAITKEDKQRATVRAKKAFDELENWTLELSRFVDNKPGMTMEEMRADARRIINGRKHKHDNQTH